MDTVNTTNPAIEPVYEEDIELLDENEHHSTVDLTRKINELIKRK